MTGFWEGSAPRLVVARKEGESAWTLEIRDARGGKLLSALRGHTAEIVQGWVVAGSLLTCARDDTVRLWDPAGGEEASFDLGRLYEGDVLQGRGSPFGLRAAFSPDGATALLYHTNFNHAHLLDLRHRRFFGALPRGAFAAPRSRPSQALMRMSTPAGMLRLDRASTVWLVGSEM